jgi:retron-type reverse transcriptase
MSDQYSYGARRYRSPHNAIVRLRQIFDKPTAPKFVLILDLLKFFDNISHEYIEEEISSKLCDSGQILISK